jgi:hypothetical protein
MGPNLVLELKVEKVGALLIVGTLPILRPLPLVIPILTYLFLIGWRESYFISSSSSISSRLGGGKRDG